MGCPLLDMEIINSPNNNLVKIAVKLKERKYRYEYGKFLLEGYRLVKDALNSYVMSDVAYQIFLSESKYVDYADEFPNAVVVCDKLFDRISDTVNSQGIIAIAAMPEFKEFPKSDLCLFLDRVRDPGNLGAIIRTAAASGFCDIVLNDCADVYNSKTTRSSMSAYLNCNFIRSCDLSKLRDLGYYSVCAALCGENIFETELPLKEKKICLIIGNEANGIDKQIIENADISVSLPMGAGVESLNASVSAGILMYFIKFFNH